ncbi:hypothetical protein CALVIDRAFT_284031 [Calocera viscosa TUFC12733]|uniref:C2 domain-containing protein n=1 Tax=Calocera viscosa (strain TUFC12733) TaxID=1330018 RepID=A0A167ITI3_CALVF|nr:hypothetical protein CALVIDRAFT_284031 [Calocera viscosa TUFC12733]
MTTPIQTPESSKSLSSIYAYSGVTIQGLPVRGIRKSDAKYFVRLSIDETEVWRSREIRSKESTVVWNKEEDRAEFECAQSENWTVTLYKNHSHGRPVEEVGAVTLRLSSWLEAMTVGRLATGPNTKDAPVLVQLSVQQKETTVPDRAIARPETVDIAEANTSATMPDIPVADPPAGADDIDTAKRYLGDIATALNGLMGKIEVFDTTMLHVSEVHPYLKMSRSAIYSVLMSSEVVKAQQDRDKEITSLIEKMTRIYDFLYDAQGLRDEKARRGVLSRLALQTLECIQFIASCIPQTNFGESSEQRG